MRRDLHVEHPVPLPFIPGEVVAVSGYDYRLQTQRPIERVPSDILNRKQSFMM
jgi:hypothetical protein